MFKKKEKVKKELEPNHSLIKTTINAINLHIGLYERQNEAEETRVKDYSGDFFLYDIYDRDSLSASVMHQLTTRFNMTRTGNEKLFSIVDKLSEMTHIDFSKPQEEDIDLYESFDRYINRVLVENRFGSIEAELLSLAKNFNMCIQVHMKNPVKPDVYWDPDYPTIYIAYNGYNKYDSLIPRQEYLLKREQENELASRMPKERYDKKALVETLKPLLNMLHHAQMPVDEQTEIRRNICQLLDIKLEDLVYTRKGPKQEAEEIVNENKKNIPDHPVNIQAKEKKVVTGMKFEELAYDDNAKEDPGMIGLRTDYARKRTHTLGKESILTPDIIKKYADEAAKEGKAPLPEGKKECTIS